MPTKTTGLRTERWSSQMNIVSFAHTMFANKYVDHCKTIHLIYLQFNMQEHFSAIKHVFRKINIDKSYLFCKNSTF